MRDDIGSDSHPGGGTAARFAATGVSDVAWVDEFLLAGPEDETCLELDAPITRGQLSAQVAQRTDALTAAGLRTGGSIMLQLPPGEAYVVTLLAAWRAGAQVSLLDHRLTAHEAALAVERLDPQVVVTMPATPEATGNVAGGPAITCRDGAPAGTGHSLLQLSSGSTGPSKVIGRTAAGLRAEVQRYQQLDGVPRSGERVVLLSSMVHVLGLVGGLLYCLHNRTGLVVPRALSTEAVLTAVAAGREPTTVIGVPFHIDYLNVAASRTQLPQLRRMTVGGELVRPAVRQRFLDTYRVPLGVMYGMTEVGVIATDLAGDHWPALDPAPGMTVREESGQLLVATEDCPYVGLTDPGRWVDGWLHTRDAGEVDRSTGRVTVRGRLDSQVSVGGLKVDLTEVEQTLAELPEVLEVVVAYDGGVEAYVVLAPPAGEADLRQALTQRLAPYKRPRRIRPLDKLPRTATGKLVRSVTELRQAARAARERHPDERSNVDVR